jgi:hypothetical protein
MWIWAMMIYGQWTKMIVLESNLSKLYIEGKKIHFSEKHKKSARDY